MAKHIERESLDRQFRATAKRRKQERRDSRAVKLDMREAWQMEESAQHTESA